jgi:pimeloyl-ACP methyl ester carboxylesterase
VLYLHGAADRCLGAGIVAGAAQFLPPGSRLELVEGSGHFLHLERPEEIAARIGGWLAG